MRSGRHLATILILLVATPATAGSLSWNLQLLPAESSWLFTNAAGVNDAGIVVGTYAATDAQQARPALWSGGMPLDLIDTYMTVAGADGGQAFAINNAGLVGGIVWAGNQGHAGVWDTTAHVFHDMHPAGPVVDPGGGVFTFAVSRLFDLNQSGQGVGILEGTPSWSAPSRAFVWDPITPTGQLLPLTSGWDSSFGQTIADDGTVLGFFGKSWPHCEAGVWQPDGIGGYTILEPHSEIAGEHIDIESTAAMGMLADGRIVGWARKDDYSRFFAWIWDPSKTETDPDRVVLLDTGGTGQAQANGACGPYAFGQIGETWPSASGHAAVWHEGLLVLPTLPGFGNMYVTAANGGGLLVGDAVFEGSWFPHEGSRAWVGTPIPEPTSSTLLLVGMACAAIWWRRASRR